MTLADGRALAWAEYGVPDGSSVLFFHGGSDSRLAGRLLADAATRAKVRLICPDRPGYGASTFSEGRTFLDWATDVSRLADELGIAGYGVVGHSGGGPHALACAHANPERVHSVATVSSPAPPAAPNRGLHPAFRFMNLLFKYRTGQFGKNHLGDMNKFLPTVHGFDEFYGPLYHLNASEEPEHPDCPTDPGFLARFGRAESCTASPATPTIRPRIREDRLVLSRDGEPGQDYLCAGLYLFFDHVKPTMTAMAQLLRRGQPPADVMETVRTEDAHRGRNDPCPCGNGAKFKRCHGAPARSRG